MAGLFAEFGMWVMRDTHRQHLIGATQRLLAPRTAVNVSQLQWSIASF